MQFGDPRLKESKETQDRSCPLAPRPPKALHFAGPPAEGPTLRRTTSRRPYTPPDHRLNALQSAGPSPKVRLAAQGQTSYSRLDVLLKESKVFEFRNEKMTQICVLRGKEMGTNGKEEKCEWQAHELEPNPRPLKRRFVFWYTRRTKVHPPPPLPALEATLDVPPPKLQDVLFYSKVYGPVKRRKVSAIRQFPPGCGPVSGATTSI
ncbi:hypothetical protein M5K25_012486 [Dendrobium thyrsiflorum]|uniref:Uncharacterized protein n=1 Tax=Dendrobium thyrsiflorum TaxID=117978 RepID=A0ABD0V405_DENTH